MNEVQLRVALGIIPDPDNNKLDIKNRMVREEIQRIVRIINITEEQKKAGSCLTVRSNISLEPVESYN